MNELIRTSQDTTGEITLSGRDLHEFLEVGTRYDIWFNRMTEYGFEKEVDFVEVVQKRTTSHGREHEIMDHQIKLDMAKEIAMIQRSEKGKEARQYFLQIEKLWNSPEMVIKRAMDFQQQKIVQLEAKVKADEKKVFLAEAIQVSENAVLIKDLATILCQRGLDIGQNRLFEILREKGYLLSSNAYWNKPSQKAMELKLFEVTTRLHTSSDGSTYLKYTPKVTGKGQFYFINKLLAGSKAI
ncbi:phage antirepressor KilAC domain-containing protein [Planomicrobium sp. MB-3u-38]|uniref:phage antirepressor KilAC domain-containing protein n=1 Tax=Planomicrobium sp. MB-3u-38 TaxID=2058318 RepID=UPI000C79FEE9|nr:phage antirepressor KilAC domain-containing protein [Planomicrobium sp. MB-3u-38]PKH09823.1 oxidoreductase [Planomicrobium sp. MB-3u-38]